MVMERNFVTGKGSAERPRRTWRKNTGPGELSFTPMATTKHRRHRDEHRRAHAQIECPFGELVPHARWGWAISSRGVPERSVRRDRQLINS